MLLADALTMGYHKRLCQGLGINGGVREDSYSYSAGFIVGTIHQFALGFSSAACGRGWMMTATRVYDALTTLEGMRDASVKLYNGTASVWDLLNFMPAAGFIAGRLFGKACFAAGTPIRTLDGSKRIEDLKVGDLVLSRHEDDPDGPIEAKAVDEIFVRESALLNLVAGGQTIKTTGEHPFYVEGKGWTEARKLQVGDRLVTLNNETITVESVSESSEFETVYNVRVADYHTYFVGTEEWAWSIWAHNVGCGPSSAQWDEYIRDSTKLFDANVRPLDWVDEPCTLAAARAGLDPALLGQARAILYFPERGHAVLGVGNNIADMVIIDNTRFARVFGGTNVPIANYTTKMGQPEPYLGTANAILDVISGRGGY